MQNLSSFILVLALATLSACATANTGGGATPLLNASACGANQLCMVQESLKSMGAQLPGIQDDGSFIGCYHVLAAIRADPIKAQTQCQSIADGRARANLVGLLAPEKAAVRQYFEDKAQITFIEGTLKGYAPVDRRATQAGNGFLICIKLKKQDLSASSGGK